MGTGACGQAGRERTGSHSIQDMFWCQWHLLMGLGGGQPRPKATVCREGRRVIERGMNEVCRENQRWVWPCKVRGAVREQVEGQGLHRRGGRRQPATSTDKP